MEHVGAHIRKLAQLLEGERFYAFGTVDNSRVAGEETAYVSPVFVQRGVDGTGDYRARDIRAAAGECFYPAVISLAVEAGKNCLFNAAERLVYSLVGLFGVVYAVFIEENDVLGVDKLCAEHLRHYARGEIFAAGSGEILVVFAVYPLLSFVEDGLNIEIYAELFYNAGEPVAYERERRAAGARFCHLFVALV